MPGTRPVVCAHSAYTLNPAQLTEITALAREHGALLHIHAAENAAEVANVVELHGMRPVELLDSLGVLGPDTLLAHAVDLTDAEIATLARTGTGVAHCPVSTSSWAAASRACPTSSTRASRWVSARTARCRPTRSTCWAR